MDQSTPCAEVRDKHRSCDTSSQAALCRLRAVVPDTPRPPPRPQLLEQLSTSVSTMETDKTPQCPSARPANTRTHKHTQGPPMCLLSKHPRHTQLIDFYSSCNLLDGQNKVSQSLQTQSVCLGASAQTHTHKRIYTNKCIFRKEQIQLDLEVILYFKQFWFRPLPCQSTKG